MPAGSRFFSSKRLARRVNRQLACVLVAASMLSAGTGCSRSAPYEVVAYVAIDQGIAEPILERFESETGICVRARYDAEAAKTSGLVARLLAESARPRCDVFWNNEPVQTFLLADRNLLEVYQPNTSESLPSNCRDPLGRWTGVAARARVIVYNTKYVPVAEVPRSLFDLAKSQWRGKVAIADPQFGTTRTHVAALFAVLGPDRAQRFLEDLLANQARIVDGNAMVKNLVARAHPDASPIFVGLTDSDDVLSGQADGEPVDMVYPDQDSFGTLVVLSTVALVRGSPHASEAKRLVDFLTNPQVESELVLGRAGFIGIRPSAAQNKTLARLGPLKPMELSHAALLSQLEPSSRWTKEYFHP